MNDQGVVETTQHPEHVTRCHEPIIDEKTIDHPIDTLKELRKDATKEVIADVVGWSVP